ncbi:2513_t:CDS:2, partial [Acaulospora morrowiae]
VLPEICIHPQHIAIKPNVPGGDDELFGTTKRHRYCYEYYIFKDFTVEYSNLNTIYSSSSLKVKDETRWCSLAVLMELGFWMRVLFILSIECSTDSTYNSISEFM